MAPSRQSLEGSLSLLPDSLLVCIIDRAVSVTPPALLTRFEAAPYIPRPVACLKALARLRLVCTRFRRLAPQVEGIFCELDNEEEGLATESHVIEFLHEAETMRAVKLAYPEEDEEIEDASDSESDGSDDEPRERLKLSVSSGFLAGMLCLAPRLERFSLTRGLLAGPDDLDDKVQALFRLLARCPYLDCLILERCHLSIANPIPQMPHSLKELHLSVIKFITTNCLISLIQAAPNLETLYLNIDGDINVDLTTTIHSTSLVRLFLDYESDRHGFDQEASDSIGPGSNDVDIKTPRLKSLHINLNGRDMTIDAPQLSSLILHGDYPVTKEVARAWDLKQLTANHAMASETLLPLLAACHCLEVVNFQYMSLDCCDNKSALILAHLKDVVEFKVSITVLESMLADMPEDTPIPAFQNLSYLLIDVGFNKKSLPTCEVFVRACPNLTEMQVESYGRPLGNARIQQPWTEGLSWLEQVLDGIQVTDSDAEESDSDNDA